MSTKAELEARILTLELALSVLQKELEKLKKKTAPITPIGVKPKPNPFPHEPWVQPRVRWDRYPGEVTWDRPLGDWQPSYQPKVWCSGVSKGRHQEDSYNGYSGLG